MSGRGGGLDPQCPRSASGRECGSKVDQRPTASLPLGNWIQNAPLLTFSFLGGKPQGRQGAGKGMPGECNGSDGDGGNFGAARVSGRGWRAGAHTEAGHVGSTGDTRLRGLPGCGRSPPTADAAAAESRRKPSCPEVTRERPGCSHQPRSRHLGRGAGGGGLVPRHHSRSGPRPTTRGPRPGPELPGSELQLGGPGALGARGGQGRAKTRCGTALGTEWAHWAAGVDGARHRDLFSGREPLLGEPGGEPTGVVGSVPRGGVGSVGGDPQCLDSLLPPGRQIWRRGL